MVMSVLMKLAGGTPSLAHELNVEAFLEQVTNNCEERGNWFTNHDPLATVAGPRSSDLSHRHRTSPGGLEPP